KIGELAYVPEKNLHRAALSADGRWALCACRDSTLLYLFDLEAPRPVLLQRQTPGKPITCLALSPDGDYAFCGARDENEVDVPKILACWQLREPGAPFTW